MYELLYSAKPPLTWHEQGPFVVCSLPGSLALSAIYQFAGANAQAPGFVTELALLDETAQRREREVLDFVRGENEQHARSEAHCRSSPASAHA
jgi:hypothetical protein